MNLNVDVIIKRFKEAHVSLHFRGSFEIYQVNNLTRLKVWVIV